MGVWCVRMHPEGRWQVLTPGGTQACSRTEDQQRAIDAARQLAGYEGEAVLVVHDASGTELSRGPVPVV